MFRAGVLQNPNQFPRTRESENLSFDSRVRGTLRRAIRDLRFCGRRTREARARESTPPRVRDARIVRRQESQGDVACRLPFHGESTHTKFRRAKKALVGGFAPQNLS